MGISPVANGPATEALELLLLESCSECPDVVEQGFMYGIGTGFEPGGGAVAGPDHLLKPGVAGRGHSVTVPPVDGR